MIVPLLLATLAASCPATGVRTDRYRGEPPSLRAVPWVATTNGAFAGHLFYWSGTRWGRAGARRAAILTTARPHTVHPKVLWIARRSTGSRRIVIRGQRLDAPGSFVSRYGIASGGDGSAGSQFPSYVLVPRAGCWRVTVRAGRVGGSVVLAAYDV